MDENTARRPEQLLRSAKQDDTQPAGRPGRHSFISVRTNKNIRIRAVPNEIQSREIRAILRNGRPTDNNNRDERIHGRQNDCF